MRRLLWIGDAACESGFARATHHTLDVLRQDWQITVLGLNYCGDPHSYPYPIYPAYMPGGDLFGVHRVISICAQLRPDVVVIQNDPWNVPRYIEKFEALSQGAGFKPILIGAIAIDGKNCQGQSLNGLDHCVFWTKFAEEQARLGGYTKTSSVVPLGVDQTIYFPGDRTEARVRLNWPTKIPLDAFVVLNVNRNQPRKRLDLMMEYFAEFYHQRKATNAYLYLHVAPTGDFGYDLDQLTGYYQLRGRVMLAQPNPYQGYPETELADVYRSANVYATTTVGEGWGLPAMEAMACGLSCVLPDWAAYGDWARSAAVMVPCLQTQASLNKVNVIGGIADKDQFVDALALSYLKVNDVNHTGIALTSQPEYRWSHIGRTFADEVMKVYDATLLGLTCQ